MHILTVPGTHSRAVAYTPDAAFLLTADFKGTLHCWNLSTFTEVLQVSVSNYPVESLSLSADRRLLCWGRTVYHATELLQTVQRLCESKATPHQFSRDNLHDLLPRVLLEKNSRHCDVAGLSPHGEIVAQLGHELGFWDREGHFLRSLAISLGWVSLLEVSPDARLLAICNGQGLRIIDTATTTVKADLKHPQSVDNAVFLPDGRLLATSAGPVVRIWDLTTFECVERYKGSRGRIAALVLHPGGRLLMAGGVGGVIRFWDMTTRHELPGRDWRIGTIYDLAFAPDGMTAAAAGHQGIMIWDVDDA